MPNLVLVHSPLVGPYSWEPVASLLREDGLAVEVPALHAEGPPYFPAYARTIADAVSEGAVLVAHSGAGALLSLAADQAEKDGRSVAGLVYVDALLPYPGRTWFDTAPPELGEHLRGLAVDGVLPSWDQWFPSEVIDGLLPHAAQRRAFTAGLPRVPLAYFAETAPSASERPGAYLRLSEGYRDEAAEAESRGWPVVVAESDHLAVITRPGLVAGYIRELAGGF